VGFDKTIYIFKNIKKQKLETFKNCKNKKIISLSSKIDGDINVDITEIKGLKLNFKCFDVVCEQGYKSIAVKSYLCAKRTRNA
jgi:hypothetical protein